MDPTAVKERFKQELLDALGDDQVARNIAEMWEAKEQAIDLGDTDLSERLDGWFDEKIDPVLKKLAEDFERMQASDRYRPPDPAGLNMFRDGPPTSQFLQRPAAAGDAGEEARHVQRFSDDVYLMHVVTRHLPAIGQHEKRDKMFRTYLDSIEAPDHVRALITPTAGGASEWIPTLLSADYYTLITDKLVIAPIFGTLPMPGKNLTIPTATGDADVYLTDGTTLLEAVAPTEDASIASGLVTFTAQTLRTRRRWSDELDEDSVPAVLQILRDKLPAGIARSIDLAILNGDTTATHHDADITVATDPRKAWTGLREKALTDSGANTDLTTFNLNSLVTIPSLMPKYADPADLVWIWGHKAFWTQLPVLADSSGNPVFLPGTFGASEGPVVSGFSGIRIMGAPVYMSSLVREDLNASGVQDGVTTTKQVLYAVNKAAWKLADRRSVTLEVARGSSGAEGGYQAIVGSWRGDFEHLESTNLTTAIGYNF
jgi:HK97 family phage major capsid protein